MKEQFIKLFEYDKTANIKVAEALAEIDNPPENCTRLLFHIGNAMDLWYRRVTHQEAVSKDLFANAPVEESKKMLIQSSDNWINFIKELPEEKLSNEILYMTIRGEQFESTIEDIIWQLLTHAPYHRGQINTYLRRNNLDTVSQDYIYYRRKNNTL